MAQTGAITFRLHITPITLWERLCDTPESSKHLQNDRPKVVKKRRFRIHEIIQNDALVGLVESWRVPGRLRGPAWVPRQKNTRKRLGPKGHPKVTLNPHGGAPENILGDKKLNLDLCFSTLI